MNEHNVNVFWKEYDRWACAVLARYLEPLHETEPTLRDAKSPEWQFVTAARQEVAHHCHSDTSSRTLSQWHITVALSHQVAHHWFGKVFCILLLTSKWHQMILKCCTFKHWKNVQRSSKRFKIAVKICVKQKACCKSRKLILLLSRFVRPPTAGTLFSQPCLEGFEFLHDAGMHCPRHDLLSKSENCIVECIVNITRRTHKKQFL